MIILVISIIVLTIIIVLSVTYFLENNKIAIIYNSKHDWQETVAVIKNIYNDLYAKKHNIILYDINSTDSNEINNKLNNLYNQGIKKYVGFSSSELLNDSTNFFDTHKDTICFSVGSTIVKTYPNNIIRPQMSDLNYIKAIDKSNILANYNKIFIIEEFGNDWSTSFVNNIESYFGDRFTYEHIILNLGTDVSSQITNIINSMDDKSILAPIISLNIDNFIKIINSIQTTKIINMFCGDGIFGFKNDAIFASKVNLIIPIFYGATSDYLLKYKNPFAINIIDSIEFIKNVSKFDNINYKTSNFIGFNGPLSLDDNNMRKYGRIIVIVFGNNVNNWIIKNIYENDLLLGELITTGNMNIYDN